MTDILDLEGWTLLSRTRQSAIEETIMTNAPLTAAQAAEHERRAYIDGRAYDAALLGALADAMTESEAAEDAAERESHALRHALDLAARHIERMARAAPDKWAAEHARVLQAVRAALRGNE